MTQKRQILLIEEDHRERTALSHEIENWGYHVSTAHDAIDAFSKIKTTSFGLIIASCELPGTSGTELLENLRNENEDIKVLFISARPSVEDAVELLKQGALDYFTKPVDQTQLRLFTEKAFFDEEDASQEKHQKTEKTNIVTCDPAIKRLLDLVSQIADSTASVLIQGESGTGKELFARFIHENSKRNRSPFIAVNCAALPETLLESELFGHEKGAFTGAVSRKPGKFELADGGTLLLDEITEMQYHLQSKLLRVLQERMVDRVGGATPVKVDVRVIATTNRDIKEAIEKGDFREDLYYRLNVIPFKIPPLRQRQGDIGLLVRYFVEKYNGIDGRNVKGLTKNAIARLESLPFKGNVREMENIIQRAVLLTQNEFIEAKDLFLDDDLDENTEIGADSNDFPYDIEPGPLKDVEKKLIFHALDKTSGNRTHAAKILGISVRTLRNKLNEYQKNM
ncbi:MAG: sigma-54 dependent transcriptional regulator [Proteobacteria bacterium]|nr:sigma-54 dependent transcriptional regulator [Pseudomonadota bacterium]